MRGGRSGGLFIYLGLLCLGAVAAGAQTRAIPDLTFAEALQAWEGSGLTRPAGVEVSIRGTDFTSASPGATEIRTGVGGRPEAVLVWTKEDTWVEWTLTVPEEGLYTIAVEYYPLPGRRGAVQRELLVDGLYPFREAKSIQLPRIWADAGPARRDNQGNDVRPRQVESPRWRKQVLSDSSGVARGPLEIHLTSGRHTLRLVATKEPVAVARIVVAARPVLPTYAELDARTRSLAPTTGIDIRIQAESAAWKTDPTLRMESTPELRADPPAGTARVFNVFGAYRWRLPGQEAAWSFEVPADGRYAISFKVLQGWNYGLPSIRAVRIDGEIPCRELEEATFPYGRVSKLVTLGGDDGPYLFYLAKGRHEISLEVRMGSVRSVIGTVERAVLDIGRLQRLVYLITGVNPDPNREWDDLADRIPELVPRFEEISRELERERLVLEAISGRERPPAGNEIAAASTQLADMAANPQSIPSRLGDLSSTTGNLVSWLLELKTQPLEIDWISVHTPDVPAPKVRAGLFERIAAGFNAFLSTFRRDYTGVGDVYGEGRTIDVWVARPLEWVEITKELAEETFTPATGIRVNISVIPADQMQAILLNALVGKAPDIALGIDPALPVDLGIRGALVDLSLLPGWTEVAGRFRPGALIPYQFGGATYALPETQSFSMLFYRTDVLGELGLEVPQTWEDVYRMLPDLQKNGLNFYYPAAALQPSATQVQTHGGLLPFLLQRGGRFYTDDGLSALDEPQALEGFREWTGLYTHWRIPRLADFHTQFRTGELPIGVSDYQSYVQFHTNAPELEGFWAMAPIPGTRRADGTIDRSAGGAGQTALIFEQSAKRKEAWAFLDWWTTAETQVRFGEELEALIGVAARWNTANLEAFQSLPWPNADIRAILSQWEWFVEQPIVLGGYFTKQHVDNAMNRVVLGDMNPREALELAVEDINRELVRKQTEFGLRTGAPPAVRRLSEDMERRILGGEP